MARVVISAIPNALTVLRFLLGIAFPWTPREWWCASILFAGISDLVDGEIGRFTGSTSTFGRLADPVADKTYILAVLGTLCWVGLLRWDDLILLAARDLTIMVICAYVLFARPTSDFLRMRPIVLGKLATAGQFVYLTVLVCYQERVPWLLYLAGAISVLAALRYLWFFWMDMKRPGTLTDPKW